MKPNSLALVFSVIGWAAIGVAVLSLLSKPDGFNVTPIICASGIFSGLLLLAIAEVINLLTKIEYNTRNEQKSVESPE